jgi:hypothetical protein
MGSMLCTQTRLGSAQALLRLYSGSTQAYSGILRLCSGMVLELSVRWYTVVYILGVYIECLPRVS